jgi:hypothetical protein
VLIHRVQLVLGIAEITLDRHDLSLADRGGFAARWADGEEGMDLEVYRNLVKQYLNEIYKVQQAQDAPRVTLNLASHQLIDDITGWSKLNAVR